MADSAKINEALGKLDPENDNHWTQGGEPRLETVRMLLGDQSISRSDVDSATKDYNRTVARAAKAPPAPPVVDQGAQGGAITGDQPTPTVEAGAGQGDIAITAPVDADANELPPAPPLPSAPPADGLPTAAEPAMVEGGEPQGTDAGERTPDVEGSASAGRPPQVTEGTTEKGYNALNSEEDDLRDAQASTAPSPNAPPALGGTPGAREVATGLSNEAGGYESTEQRRGEAQHSAVDRGADGDADEVASLEAELAEVSKAADYARGEADKWQGRVAEATAEESRLRVAIERARPRGGTMPAIQSYFAQLDASATESAEARQRIKDSGLDFKQLKKLVEDPTTGNLR